MATPFRVEHDSDEGALMVPTERIRPFSFQPRKYFNKKRLIQLGKSMKITEQISPILVRTIVHPDYDYELVDGERRLRAAKLVGLPLMKVTITTVKDRQEQHRKSAIANFGGQDHTVMETAHAIREVQRSEFIQRLPKSEQVAALAQTFSHTEAWVYQYLGLFRLHRDVRKRLEPNTPKHEKLSFSLALYISTLPEDIQLQVTHEVIRRKLTLNQARVYVREVSEAQGVEVGRMGRGPKDDYRILVNFLNRTRRDSEQVADAPRIARFMQWRSPQEQSQLLSDINESMSNMEKLRQLIRKANVRIS